MRRVEELFLGEADIGARFRQRGKILPFRLTGGGEGIFAGFITLAGLRHLDGPMALWHPLFDLLQYLAEAGSRWIDLVT